MGVAANVWYASGLMWTIVGVVVGAVALVASVVAIRIAWLTYVLRQRLRYRAVAVTPLLSAPAGVREDLELLHQGKPLSDPHVVEVLLVNAGRRDIPSSAFDRQRPLEFWLGAPIVGVLQVRCEPPSSPRPATELAGETLRVGAELIASGQRITI